MAYQIFDNDLRLMAKKANERMRQLEKQGINSPAFRAVQARLEQMGKQKAGDKGRRFSETGKGTRNEILAQKKALNDFLNQRTSTLTGAKEYRKKVLETAKERYHYDEYGIDDDEWLNIWDELDDYGEPEFGSDQVIEIIETYTRKNKDNPEAMNITDLIRNIQGASSYQGALKSIGLTIGDIAKFRSGQDEGF